jgi:hypothetical protein
VIGPSFAAGQIPDVIADLLEVYVGVRHEGSPSSTRSNGSGWTPSRRGSMEGRHEHADPPRKSG